MEYLLLVRSTGFPVSAGVRAVSGPARLARWCRRNVNIGHVNEGGIVMAYRPVGADSWSTRPLLPL